MEGGIVDYDQPSLENIPNELEALVNDYVKVIEGDVQQRLADMRKQIFEKANQMRGMANHLV